MSYDEAVIQTAIALYSGKNIGNPALAIDSAEAFVDLLVTEGYVEPPEDESPTSNPAAK